MNVPTKQSNQPYGDSSESRVDLASGQSDQLYGDSSDSRVDPATNQATGQSTIDSDVEMTRGNQLPDSGSLIKFNYTISIVSWNKSMADV